MKTVAVRKCINSVINIVFLWRSGQKSTDRIAIASVFLYFSFFVFFDRSVLIGQAVLPGLESKQVGVAPSRAAMPQEVGVLFVTFSLAEWPNPAAQMASDRLWQ